MESFGYEREVQQGEDWNLDLLVSSSNREYIPYIVSSERNNPFFVVTVASTKYEKNLRYVKSWWNSVESLGIPTFYQTVPELYLENVLSVSDLPTGPSSAVDGPTYDEYLNNNTNHPHRYLYYYTLATDTIDPALGHKPYYYFYFDYTVNNGVWSSAGTRTDGYSCDIRFNFLSSETADWTSQNYMYQVTLVSGQLLADRLNEIYNAHGRPDDWPDTVEAQYHYVKVAWPNTLQPDIDADSPLGYIETPEPILPPTKLQVRNNLRRLI